MDGSTLSLDPIESGPQPGALLDGKYRIVKLMARGGMGAIYAAHHEILDQPVAVKVLLREHAARPGAVARFMNEARAVAKLRSEHIAAVMDVGHLQGDSAYMVIEYLEGANLDDHVTATGPQPALDAVRYVLQALEALAQAHARGIIHRDLKPANLFLTRRPDGSPIIKVLDFGISKITRPALTGEANLTATLAIMGSPATISPEQLRNSKGVDPRTDIWAMGVILYHLLSSKLPFQGESIGEIFTMILEVSPPRLGTLLPELDPALDDVVFRCLERDRDARYSNVGELAQALAPFAPPDAALLVERITRTLANPPSSPSLADALPRPSRVETIEAASEVAPSKPDVAPSPPPAPPPPRITSPAVVALGVAALAGVLAVGVLLGEERSRTRAVVAFPPSAAVNTAPAVRDVDPAPHVAPPVDPSPAATPADPSAAARVSGAPARPPRPALPRAAPAASTKAPAPPPPADDAILLQRR